MALLILRCLVSVFVCDSECGCIFLLRIRERMSSQIFPIPPKCINLHAYTTSSTCLMPSRHVLLSSQVACELGSKCTNAQCTGGHSCGFQKLCTRQGCKYTHPFGRTVDDNVVKLGELSLSDKDDNGDADEANDVLGHFDQRERV